MMLAFSGNAAMSAGTCNPPPTCAAGSALNFVNGSFTCVTVGGAGGGSPCGKAVLWDGGTDTTQAHITGYDCMGVPFSNNGTWENWSDPNWWSSYAAPNMLKCPAGWTVTQKLNRVGGYDAQCEPCYGEPSQDGGNGSGCANGNEEIGTNPC